MASLNHRGSALLGYTNAYHLLRRATYKVNKERIDYFAGLDIDQALNELFDYNDFDFAEFVDQEPLKYSDGLPCVVAGSQPSFSLDPERGVKENSVRSWFVHEAYQADTIRFKMAFFLHSIFITFFQSNYYQAYDLMKLQLFYSKRSYKDFARKVTVDNSMLIYLNNNVNRVSSPNENYAREFLELFTITKSTQVSADDYTTYTEYDVQQAAKVLTGFGTRTSRDLFDAETGIPKGSEVLNNHNTENKTFSYRFANTTIIGATTAADMPRELDDFVNMVFSQDYTAVALARRLYRFFVHGQISTEIETDIIAPLATYIKANDYNLELAVKKLLSSTHFFDEDDATAGDENIGGLIKTPLDLFLQTTSLFRIKFTDLATNRTENYGYFKRMAIDYFMKNTNLYLFRPNTVAGYVPIYQEPDYDRSWISVNTIQVRYNLASSLIDSRDRVSGTNARIFATFDALDFLENSGYFTTILNNLYANPFVNASTEMPNLMQAIVGIAFVKPLTTERYNELYTTHLLGGLSEINWAVEWKNYKDGVVNGDDIVITLQSLFRAILESPEYQIF